MLWLWYSDLQYLFPHSRKPLSFISHGQDTLLQNANNNVKVVVYQLICKFFRADLFFYFQFQNESKAKKIKTKLVWNISNQNSQHTAVSIDWLMDCGAFSPTLDTDNRSFIFWVVFCFFHHRLAFERALSLDSHCTGAMTGLAILELNSKKVC